MRIGSIRTSVKLSTHLTTEEFREAISKMTGVPVYQLPPIDVEAERAIIRQQHEKVQKIIAGTKALLDNNPKTTADKYEELFDIGKFIIFFNDKFQIQPAIQEFPDFTLTYENFKIGVEHTRLLDNEERAMFKAAKHYIGKAEEILKGLSYLSRTVNILIDYSKTVIGQGNFNNRKFTKEQRGNIPAMIADFVRSELIGGNTEKPDFILQIEITRNEDSRVDLELAERYLTKTEFSKHLLECIRKKEEKALKYRDARDVNGLWLLVVVDDVNSFSGFNLEVAPLPKIEKSNFDSIALFEKFTGNIYICYIANKPDLWK